MKSSRKGKSERVFALPKHSSRIKHERKEVRRVRDPKTNMLPCADEIPQEDYLNDLFDIAASIQNGKGVDEKYYRSSQGKDYLLNERGWLHLHLAGDVLLICEQTEEAVIFIALMTHDIFAERPRGKSLTTYSQQLEKLKLPAPKTEPAPKPTD